jgi:hypothetical protein
MRDTMTFQARQGDVFIMACAAIPKGAIKQKDCVLAVGEVTTHKHQIKEEAFLWVDTDGTKYVEVFGSEATVTHEEHGEITLPGPAIYRVTIQREYHPEAIRNVAD